MYESEEQQTGPIERHARLRTRLAKLAFASVLASGIAVGSFAVAGAATKPTTHATKPAVTRTAPGPQGPQRPALAVGGTVASVGTNSFTVTDRAGNVVTVDVGSSTTYMNAGTSATFSAVTVGATVGVVGSTSAGTVTATQVLVGQPPAGPGGMMAGCGPGGAPGASSGATGASGASS